MTEKPTEEYPIGTLCVVVGTSPKNIGKRVVIASPLYWSRMTGTWSGKTFSNWAYEVEWIDAVAHGPHSTPNGRQVVQHCYLRRIDRDPDAEIKTDKEMEKVQ